MNEVSLTNCNVLSSVSGVGTCGTLTKFILNDSKVSVITDLSTLTGLTYLDLSKNQITDITALGNLESLETLNLKNNLITDITPLVTAIGTDEVINYTKLDISGNNLGGINGDKNVKALLKLHKANLEKITVTNSGFSQNEIGYLCEGMTIDEVWYEGFGSSNVIN